MDPGPHIKARDRGAGAAAARRCAALCPFLGALLLWAGLAASAGAAAEVIEPPASFLKAAFGAEVPPPKLLWLTKPLQEELRSTIGHGLGVLRLRYWDDGRRTAWILEETGKFEPITAGFVVEDGRLIRVSVLIYRESRGYEIRYPQFRRQFVGAGLDSHGRLDRRIDGISGATLSVNAMIRMARAALVLDRWVRRKGPAGAGEGP